MTDTSSIRITQNGKTRNYITYLQNQLESDGLENGEVCFYGSGRATTKVVCIAEILKDLITGLHQVTETLSIKDTDTDEIEPVIQIRLSKSAPTDTTHSGYQH